MTKLSISVQHEQGKEGKQPLVKDVESPTEVVHRKRFVAPSCIVIVTVFVLLILAGIGLTTFSSIKLYRNQNFNTYETVCTIIDDKSESHELKQQTTIDIDSQIENITVPKYDLGDQADFLHDFKRNVSVIRVVNESICYFMNLDRSRIPEPRNLLSILTATLAGKYVISPERVQDFYSVQRKMKPKVISDMYGAAMSSMCGGQFQSFWLEKIAEESELLRETTTLNLIPLFWGPQLFNGEEIIEYIINTKNYKK